MYNYSYQVQLLLFCYVVSMSQVEARKPSLRIIGGRDAEPGEFPYVVQLVVREILKETSKIWSENVCSGSALSQTAVLTAGHCCTMLSSLTTVYHNGTMYNIERTFVVRYSSSGDGTPTASDINVNVLRYILPPSAHLKEEGSIIYDDIALLETEPAPIRTFAKISALDYRSAFGQRVLVMGYGLTNQSDGMMFTTSKLRKPLQVVDALWTRCEPQIMFPLVCVVEPCDRHSSVCGGDSGGPVMHASGILGINVLGINPQNCQNKTKNARYSYMVHIVPVSIYLHWISDEVAKMTEQ